MSLEFVINGEASAGAWEKPGPLQLHAPNGGNLTDGPLGGPSQYHGLWPWLIIRYCIGSTSDSKRMLKTLGKTDVLNRYSIFILFIR